MFQVNGTAIEISRGDTGVFTITFTGEDKPENGTRVLVSLKRTATSTETIWEKELTVLDDTVTVSLTTQDTNINFGKYLWDVRILYDDGSVYTPIAPASFRVVEVVGNVE